MAIEERKIKRNPELVLTGINLYSILNPKLINKIKKTDWVIDPASIIFVCHQHSKDKKPINFSILSLSHKGRKELDGKVMHIDSENEQLIQTIKKVIMEK